MRQLVAENWQVRQFELQALHSTGDDPFVKYPLPQAPQVWFDADSTAGAVQLVQVVAVPAQVRQFELQAVHTTGLEPLVKYPAPQAAQVELTLLALCNGFPQFRPQTRPRHDRLRAGHDSAADDSNQHQQIEKMLSFENERARP